MDSIELKCTVEEGCRVEEPELSAEYGETFEVTADQLRNSESLRSAVFAGWLVIEDRRTYAEPPSGQTGSDEEDPEVTQEASVDMSALEDLMARQVELLERIEAKIGNVGPIPRSSGGREEPERRRVLDDGPDFIPSKIRTGEAKVSNLADTEESESSSGSVDAAALALKEMKEDSDE